MPLAAPSSDLNRIVSSERKKHMLVVFPLTVVELPYDCWDRLGICTVEATWVFLRSP